MTATLPDVSVVWFKRDLRLTEHAPLQQAIALGVDYPAPLADIQTSGKAALRGSGYGATVQMSKRKTGVFWNAMSD